uniref:Uncharacterized protein n=1 Tax=viral metagenome TaxID=1070528 RepID=A0A6M3LBR4_9ZZZZ
MNRKQCFKCKEIKLIENFRQYKSGINKGYYFSYCMNCMSEYKKNRNKHLNKYPWHRTYKRIKCRCYWKNHKGHKYYKNIKNFLSVVDIKFLWFRDGASSMQRPSIDRKNSKEDYTLDNCRYIELRENVRRGSIERWRRYWLNQEGFK